MALITFDDKDNSLPTSNPRRLGRAEDLNEIKNVVNENAGNMATKLIAFDTPLAPEDAACPTAGTGEAGAVLGGNRFRLTRMGYLPGADGPEQWPTNTIAEAMEDGPGNDPTKWRYY
jgi:hypothetical protein